MSTQRQRVQLARTGNVVSLRMHRQAAARALALDPSAPRLARLLAAGASGVMEPALIQAVIERQPALIQAVSELAQAAITIGDGAQVGDVTIGPVAGRDVVTITVNVYGLEAAP